MKICIHCRQNKPNSEFYKKRIAKDGLQPWCKECSHQSAAKYGRSDKGKIARYNYQRTEKGRYARKRATDNWRKRNPLATTIYNQVEEAIKKGKIVRPNYCEHCFRKGPVFAHHQDYTKPFEIIWLCPQCHHNIHVKAAIG